jgi:hypothetical protein
MDAGEHAGEGAVCRDGAIHEGSARTMPVGVGGAIVAIREGTGSSDDGAVGVGVPLQASRSSAGYLAQQDIHPRSIPRRNAQ